MSIERTSEIIEKSAVVMEDDVIREPRESRIKRHTRDFVKETLYDDLTPRDFEEFVADLLKSLGYQARVTRYLQDGDIDVIAHRDLLGGEPRLIKVQCKHQVGELGSPEVQPLSGTQGPVNWHYLRSWEPIVVMPELLNGSDQEFDF